VIYRVDRVSGYELSFNAGGRIEKTDGRVVSVVTPVGGMYDTASPPGGWGRKDVRLGMRWHLDYVATAGDKLRYELEAIVIGERSTRVDGTEMRVLGISYEGWIRQLHRRNPAGTACQPACGQTLVCARAAARRAVRGPERTAAVQRHR